MATEKHIKIWTETWTQETHETEYALKRIKSAQSAKLTPVEINSEDSYGYFQGSSGRYETFLDYCPCGDFRRNRLPCKHIYRLGIELGVINIKANKNANSIPVPQNQRLTLDETIDLVETLSIDAQHELCNIAKSVNSSNPLYRASSNNKYIIELLGSGILIDYDPEKHLINFGTKNEILELLNSEGVLYLKNDKKSILQELCMEHLPEKAREKFGEIINVTIPKKFSKQKIHYYLHRKYDYKLSCDANMNFTKIPLLETDLPDDDVTGQLIKRGYYVRKISVL